MRHSITTNTERILRRVRRWGFISLLAACVVLYLYTSDKPPNLYSTYAALTSLPSKYTKSADKYKHLIEELSASYFDPRYSPYFIAQATAESSLNPKVVNSIGACGLFQFMPGTWRWMKNLYPDTLGGEVCTDAESNTRAAILYAVMNDAEFAKTVDGKCTRLAMVIASHNAGPGRVALLQRRHPDTWRDKLPLETRNYLRAVNNLAGLYVKNGWNKEKFCELV